MTSERSEAVFVRLLAKGYVSGTFASAIALHIAVSIIAPGGGGTMLALSDGVIFFVLLVALGVAGLLLFPVAALASWPFRRLVFERPFWASVLCLLVGVAVGAVATLTEFQIGPGDFWSGPLVGLIYSAVWFLVVRSSSKLEVVDATRLS